MLGISLKGVGKHYNRRWVFRGLDLEIAPGERLAIKGANGSGKSTLLSMLSGQLQPSAGTVTWALKDRPLSVDALYRHLSWMGPSIALYDDLTLEEASALHYRFKRCLLPKPAELAQTLRLHAHRQKPLRAYSSGMRQRAKIGLALFAESDLLMLDEPTSFMDTENASFLHELIDAHIGERTLVLASNQPEELARFERVVSF